MNNEDEAKNVRYTKLTKLEICLQSRAELKPGGTCYLLTSQKKHLRKDSTKFEFPSFDENIMSNEKMSRSKSGNKKN